MKEERLSLWMSQTMITFVLFVKIYLLSHFNLNADTSSVTNAVNAYLPLTKLIAPRVVIRLQWRI